MRLPALALLSLVIAPNAFAQTTWQEIVMGDLPTKRYSDPRGRFSTEIVTDWRAEVNKQNPQITDFLKTNSQTGIRAHATVEVRNIPNGTKLKHFVNRNLENIEAKAPRFRMIGRKKIVLGGRRAYRVIFGYQNKNNAEQKNEVTQIYLLSGEKGYILSLETALGAGRYFAYDFKKMSEGFSVGGFTEAPTTPGRARKRIRAGEMIDPDAIGY